MFSTINWPYVAVMSCAVGVGAWLLRREQRGLTLSTTERIGVGLGAFCGAMIGAKLPFLFSDWEAFRSGAVWLANGKTIVCGLAGGYFGVEVAKWALEIRTRTGDSFAVPAAVTVAIGRLGCYVGGCCYGAPTTLPWGMKFPTALDGPDLARHPTQLYEAAFHLTMAAVLAWLKHRGIWPGQLMKVYIIAYLIYRFLSESIRPEPVLWLGLTGYQWGTLALLPVFAWLWMRDRQAMSAAQAT